MARFIFWLLKPIKCQVRDIQMRFVVPTSFALNQALSFLKMELMSEEVKELLCGQSMKKMNEVFTPLQLHSTRDDDADGKKKL